MKVVSTLESFDLFLEEKGIKFEAIIIGGAALSVMSVITRETVDVDCLHPLISSEVLSAAAEFRMLNPNLMLIEQWINNGPDTLIRDLEPDWQLRCILIFKGKAITFHTLGRLDLLKTKLFAYCDRDTDLQDCLALNPTKEELDACLGWVTYRDASEGWPNNVKVHFDELRRLLKYES